MASIRERMDELERRLGKGSTFDPGTRRLISEGVVPLRVALATKVLRGEDQAAYQKAFSRLVEMEKQHGSSIDLAAYGIEKERAG